MPLPPKYICLAFFGLLSMSKEAKSVVQVVNFQFNLGREHIVNPTYIT